MATHLKEREYYEDLYDKQTVEIGRRETGSFLRAREGFYREVKVKDQEEKDVLDFWWTRLYWWMIEVPVLLERWENKKITVDQWMTPRRNLAMLADNMYWTNKPPMMPCYYRGFII
ncbi:hypothetical protein KDA11_00525, partial [Candidatus Saccharibacteria bacterium]|nr:hypothetical protein [Candidatus Saccharibacteria bacterium]